MLIFFACKFLQVLHSVKVDDSIHDLALRPSFKCFVYLLPLKKRLDHTIYLLLREIRCFDANDGHAIHIGNRDWCIGRKPKFIIWNDFACIYVGSINLLA